MYIYIYIYIYIYGRWGNFIMEKPSHPADVARFGVPTANCAGCCDTTPIHRSPSDRRALGIFWCDRLRVKPWELFFFLKFQLKPWTWKTWRKHVWTEYIAMLLYQLPAFGVGILDKNIFLRADPVDVKARLCHLPSTTWMRISHDFILNVVWDRW